MAEDDHTQHSHTSTLATEKFNERNSAQNANAINTNRMHAHMNDTNSICSLDNLLHYFTSVSLGLVARSVAYVGF